MMSPAYLFVAGTVVMTVYGQLIVKWQTSKAGVFPAGTSERIRYLVHFFGSPWVLSSLLATAVAAVCWIAALSQLDLSRAYPFVSASFILVLVLSAIVFGESLTAVKLAGALLIIGGLILGSR
jgi:drug/metabolite transporter (DMT)-like permease